MYIYIHIRMYASTLLDYKTKMTIHAALIYRYSCVDFKISSKLL